MHTQTAHGQMISAVLIKMPSFDGDGVHDKFVWTIDIMFCPMVTMNRCELSHIGMSSVILLGSWLIQTL